MALLQPTEPWRKVASVTHGGKPFFYIAASRPGVFWRIVWHRDVQAYALSHDSLNGTLGFYSTPKEAQQAVKDRFSS